MSNETKIVSMSVYDTPPFWYELSIYVLAVLLMAGGVVTSKLVFLVGLASCLMYWNYRYFRLIASYIRLLNVSEFNRLVKELSDLEDEGTFPDDGGLSTDKEDDDEKAED
jgi:hypothetical protein